MRRFLLALALIGAGCSLEISSEAAATIAPSSSGSFTFDPGTSPPVRVFYDAPSNLTNARILIVLHGSSRTAESFRNVWDSQTRPRGVLLLAPRFAEADYPGERYSIPNDATRQVVEALFDAVVAMTGNASTRYLLYGHSAGAQFVHRFLLYEPHRVAGAVAANAGWYTAPEAVAWPYGLTNAPTPKHANRWLIGGLRVLLGAEDDDPDAADLRHTPEAERQGPHRLARGRYFYARGVELARARWLRFGWSIEEVPGAGHSNAEMAPAAARFLLG